MIVRTVEARPGAVTGAVLVVAVLVHGLLALDYLDDPFRETLVSDALSYHRWAERIAAHGLAAEPVFHQSPLYPILLAGIYTVVEAPARSSAVLLIQIVLSGSAVALLVPLGRRLLGSVTSGLAAAALALLHGPLAFHALKVLPVSLAVATQAGALLVLARARERPGAGMSVAAGVAWGLACLTRSEALLFLPVAALALLPVGATHLRSRLRHPVLLLAGALLPIGMATAHNLRHGDFVLVASAAGENLFAGNQREADGGHAPLDPQAGDLFSQRELARRIAEEHAGQALRASEISAFWRGRALAEIRADPPRWIGLELRKAARLVHPGDPTDMYSFALERSEYLTLLYALPLPATALWILAAVGTWLVARDGLLGRAWPLLALLAVHAIVLLAFFVSTRLRLPVLYLLAPLGGYAVAACGRLWTTARPLVLATAVAVVGVSIAAPVLFPASGRERVRLASVLSMQDRPEEGLRVLAPEIDRAHPDPLASDQAGWLLYKLGRHRDAVHRYEQALAGGLPPGRQAQTRTRMAWALERLGRLDDAEAAHDAAVSSGHANAGTYHERALFRARRGDRAGAIRDLGEAILLDPSWPAPRQALARLQRP